MTEAAAEAEAAAAEAAAAEAAVKEEEHEKLPEEVTESVVEVCQELTVLSNNHKNRTTGQYFNVNIDCIEYLTGSTFSSPERLADKGHAEACRGRNLDRDGRHLVEHSWRLDRRCPRTPGQWRCAGSVAYRRRDRAA